ncbi:uncharacterized protein V1510DRAFT_407180 [Dipodascopsis tothii]|uniref:uncharacterized protein n=1 Tax=Dipodascopsis tothii TaxID=44089 RepID=UPI0034CE1416
MDIDPVLGAPSSSYDTLSAAAQPPFGDSDIYIHPQQTYTPDRGSDDGENYFDNSYSGISPRDISHETPKMGGMAADNYFGGSYTFSPDVGVSGAHPAAMGGTAASLPGPDYFMMDNDSSSAYEYTTSSYSIFPSAQPVKAMQPYAADDAVPRASSSEWDMLSYYPGMKMPFGSAPAAVSYGPSSSLADESSPRMYASAAPPSTAGSDVSLAKSLHSTSSGLHSVSGASSVSDVNTLKPSASAANTDDRKAYGSKDKTDKRDGGAQLAQPVSGGAQVPNSKFPCLTTATALAAEEIAMSSKRVRRHKNSISEKAAMLNREIRPPLNTIGSRKPLVLPELPPGKTKEDLDPEDLARYKHVHRLLRNRVAALASREKKKMYIEHLEEQNGMLEQEKRELEAKAEELKQYVEVLEKKLKDAESPARYMDNSRFVAQPVVVKQEDPKAVLAGRRFAGGSVIRDRGSDPMLVDPLPVAAAAAAPGPAAELLAAVAGPLGDQAERAPLAVGMLMLMLVVNLMVTSERSYDAHVVSPSAQKLASQILQGLRDPHHDETYIRPMAGAERMGLWKVTKHKTPEEVSSGTVVRVIAPLDSAVPGPADATDVYVEEVEMVVNRRETIRLDEF